MASQKNFAIGIDLGTTNCCIGVVRNGRVEIIANDLGIRTTPSYVAFTDSERLIGDAAVSQAMTNPTNTVYDIKRLMGRKYGDEEIQKYIDHWPFKVRNDQGSPKIEVCYKRKIKQFSPEEISSMVLIKMKETAESYLGCPVTDAVITVPAYFNDSQRQATIDAGTIAGFNVLSIINEPTAAAIAYGVDKQVTKRRNILVYDLGGGTFDVAILAVEMGKFEVKAVTGDTYLGGADFDNLLMDHFLLEFKEKHNVDLSERSRARAKLKKACEKAKRNLSMTLKERIQIFYLDDQTGLDFDSSITRDRFEELCSDAFEATLDSLQNVLQDAGMGMDEIDEVILAGGSTRIPKIQELLQEYFAGKKLNKTMNPDEAVAYGAALHAAVVSGDCEVEELLLRDVCPLSLGIATIGGYTSVIIRRNTKLPAEATKTYDTTADYQDAIDIKVYEGERTMCSENNLLGQFTLEGIQRKLKGEVKVDVTFTVDENGILTASAVDPKSGSGESIVVTSRKGRLAGEEIFRMVAEAKEMREVEASQLEDELGRSEVEELLQEATTINDDTPPGGDDEEDVEFRGFVMC